MEQRFVSAKSSIESLRDNGFQNTAYALAELLDNSIQAKASRIEVAYIEVPSMVKQRTTSAVQEICVLDDGIGMSPETLLMSMSFGEGLNRTDKSGMGKFGMGLPNSSISQCRRLDVWSWQKGQPPYKTYLDVLEMAGGKLEFVPLPEVSDIPERYKSLFPEGLPPSGTLIVWSDLDRLRWKTGKSIHKHCEQLIGRMYRRFIADGKIRIESKIYQPVSDNKLEQIAAFEFKANDPLYLFKNTSLPELPGEYKNESFFEKLDEVKLPVKYRLIDGSFSEEEITIRSSIVKKSIALEILKGTSQRLGATPWGKHCARNVGVSIVRAGRELILRTGFTSSDKENYKNRFSGLEVEFSPALDEVFGVTNNKQDAVALIPYTDLAQLAAQNGFDSEQEYLEDLKENEDPIYEVIKVSTEINMQLQKIARELKTIPVDGFLGPQKLEGQSTAEDRATLGSKHREEHGNKAADFNSIPDRETLKDLMQQRLDLDDEEASRRADDLLLSGRKFIIEEKELDTEGFFEVSVSKGLTLVLFNKEHIFYKQFVAKLPPAELDVLRTAIAGFARVMNETTDPERKRFLNSVRRNWGSAISDFLEGHDDDDSTED